MLQVAPERKSKRLVALCPPDLHGAFMDIALRSGESAGVLLRRLVSEAVDQARKGQPIGRRLSEG